MTDKLGVTTSYTYDAAGQTLAAVRRPLTAADTAATTFAAAERSGLAPQVVLADSVVTLLDGPRLDVPHTTRFWLGRFGGPRRVRDAVGHETVLTTDPAFPGLVSRVVGPTGFTTTAAYDARGNLITQTAIDPLDGAGDAVTHYAYDRTFNVVTRITGPTGEVWRATYDPATGNRTREQRTASSSRYDVSYTYDPACGLVAGVTTVATSSTTTVDYDAQCNVRGVETPLGHWTRFGLDALGLVVADTAPAGRVDSTVYDVMDRVVATRTTGPDRNGSGVQTVDVRETYDLIGRLLRVARVAVPDPANIDTVVTAYRYDWAGRRVATISPWASPSGDTTVVDSTHYDRAGNPDTVVTRRGHVITLQYDTLNRLTQRAIPAVHYPAEHIGMADVFTIPVSDPYPFYPNVPGDPGYTVPAQVEHFAYDDAGRLTRANNGDARVSRIYYPNGLLATETDSLRTLADIAAGGDFSSHVYTTRYAYDLAGRLTTLAIPSQLAPRIQPNALTAVLLSDTEVRAVADSTIDYTYDTGADGTGWLSAVGGLLPGDVFTYTYTPRGEVETLTALASAAGGVTAQPVVDHRTYDLDGRLATHTVTRGSDVLRDMTVTGVDAAGRLLGLTDAAAHGIRIRPTTASYEYSGLGALLSSAFQTTDIGGTTLTSSEDMTYDALGNWRTRHVLGGSARPGGFQTSMGTGAAGYAGGTGRLMADTTGGSDTQDWVHTFVYDSAGNLHAMLGAYQGDTAQFQDRVSYYGADGRLAAADARVAGNTAAGENSEGHAAFEVYRYDALGRRVWAWVRRWCSDEPGAGDQGDEAPCDVSAIRRTVWRGAQELAEIQMPAGSTTPADTVENDTAPVQRHREALVNPQPNYDQNRLYGRVLYVHGLGLDEPLAITRINYADASDAATGTVPYAVYAPFSIIPLWNRQGRADRAVLGGPAAAGRDALCADATNGRCVDLNYDAELFPYARSAADPGVWQGTLVVDKPDATGTYYRRNRSYDPATARWTQEDPAGLAGGLNLYGFAGGDPANLSDPFGLRACCDADDWAAFVKQTGALLHPVVLPLEIAGVVVTSLPFAAEEIPTGLSLAAASEVRAPAAAGAASAAVTDRVIGSYGESGTYLQVGEAIGAKTFDIPPNVWARMPKAAQWAANQKFLDRGIAVGAEFALSTRRADIEAETSLAYEVGYLLENGYAWSASGQSLIPK